MTGGRLRSVPKVETLAIPCERVRHRPTSTSLTNPGAQIGRFSSYCALVARGYCPDGGVGDGGAGGGDARGGGGGAGGAGHAQRSQGGGAHAGNKERRGGHAGPGHAPERE
eukprot:1195031-Prorocentrum_minimum.AAC.1